MASVRVEASESGVVEPRWTEVLTTVGIALTFVAVTRIPFARSGPIETDEWQFLARMEAGWFPIHHTLFQTAGKLVGLVVGDLYRGLVALDMIVSALALVSIWWWLRALVRPATALAATVLVAVSPLFWSLGEMAGNYTMIPVVGSFLLGVAYRGWHEPKNWHPYASAVVLAVGTGYRQDIGTFLLPIFGVILWNYRRQISVLAGSLAVFTVVNLAWLGAMLDEVGGWAEYQAQSSAFAYSAGYKNSVWNLGLVDAPVRYSVKMMMAILWTFGPALVFAPRGWARMGSLPGSRRLPLLLVLAVAPALGSHLLVHFGVAGYSFHYLPALVALVAVGVGGEAAVRSQDHAPRRLALVSVGLALVFLAYPVEPDRPGWRGDFDVAVARYTRTGLQVDDLAHRAPATWRTSNSVVGTSPRAN